ncbi:hypothetical protein HYX00_04670 [Candidatus Woesearchaeota archaeon]|nr:hypothetical protein [Candidatus Woesearchaeota archaeon]
MVLAIYPYAYFSVLPDSTLTTRIRQKTWNLDRLFPVYSETKRKFKQLMKDVKNKRSSVDELQHQIILLATEIRTTFMNLKLINFCDSALLYLHFRLLHRVFNLCKKEQARLEREKQISLPEGKLKDKKIEDIKKAKEIVERKIKDFEELIRKFDIAERELIRISALLLNRLRKLRWKTEKRAQQEFSFEELTLRSMENLNRKIKVEAIKVKKLIPEKTFLLKRVERQGKPNPEDVMRLAKLVADAIDSISKDASYSSKLVAKFQKEMAELKRDTEKLKKRVTEWASREKAAEMMEPCDKALKYLEEEAHKDAMGAFRNAFVEYKEVAKNQLSAA